MCSAAAIEMTWISTTTLSRRLAFLETVEEVSLVAASRWVPVCAPNDDDILIARAEGQWMSIQQAQAKNSALVCWTDGIMTTFLDLYPPPTHVPIPGSEEEMQELFSGLLDSLCELLAQEIELEAEYMHRDTSLDPVDLSNEDYSTDDFEGSPNSAENGGFLKQNQCEFLFDEEMDELDDEWKRKPPLQPWSEGYRCRGTWDVKRIERERWIQTEMRETEFLIARQLRREQAIEDAEREKREEDEHYHPQRDDQVLKPGDEDWEVEIVTEEDIYDE